MLEGDYTGYAFLARPAAQTDPRAAVAADMPRPHWFWSIVGKFWANYGHVAIAAFVVNVLALASPLFVMSVYDRVIPNGATASLVALSIGLVIAMGVRLPAAAGAQPHHRHDRQEKIDVVLAANIFEHVMSLKLAQRPASVGVLANQLRDFDSVREFFTSGTVVSVTDLLFAVVVFLAVLFVVAGAARLCADGHAAADDPGSASRCSSVRSSAPCGACRGRPRRATACWSSRCPASRRCAPPAARRACRPRGNARSPRPARSGEDVHFWSSLALTASSTAQQLTSFLIIVIGVYLILDGKLSVGALVAANMLAGRVLAPIAGIAAVITRGTQTFSALKAIDRVMALERERPPERIYVSRKIAGGGFAFTNVTFRYPGAQENALEQVSFSVRPGERIGIIGRVGSGKTTVGKLLVGFYEPTEGGILVDDVDIRQYDPADLRAGVGLVLQDTDLFYGKLRDNITVGRPTATDAEVIAAARLSGLESFIAGHPLGYEMPIAEGGRSLSGGQKQAIGLSRVLIRHPKILFLDEPTAHFDVRSESEFLERLKTIAKGEMTIMVATHRPSLLGLVDRLLVFDKGRLVADGPRDEVLAKLRAAPVKPAGGDNVRQAHAAL